jgi:hypothetical protein
MSAAAVRVVEMSTWRHHGNLRTRRRMSSQKWKISLVKQGKFKVGVVPADILGCLQLKTILCIY